MAFWRSANQEPDSELQGILTRFETGVSTTLWIGREHENGFGKFGVENAKEQEWALSDSGPWSIWLEFVHQVKEGPLRTQVISHPHWASVKVTLDQDTRQLSLFDRVYMDREFAVPSGTVVNRAIVRHLRDWVRRQARPSLEAEKNKRESALRQERANLDAMRKKYLG